MFSNYFSLGNVADLAASMGYKVTGNLEGATVGRQAYTLGPITSVFMSKFLVDKLKIENAAPIPVGFNGATAPQLSGAIAKQFPSQRHVELTVEQADREVIEAYLTLERPEADKSYKVPIFDVPVVKYADIIETKRVGRTRTDVLKYGDLPEKYYLRVAGSADDLETLEAICQEDGVAFVMDEVSDVLNCYITNVDLCGFPPLPEYLIDVTLEKDVPVGAREGVRVGGAAPGGPFPRAPAGTRGGPSASAQTKDAGELPLPEEWTEFMECQDVTTYNAVVASTAFAKAVASNKRAIGSNKYGWAKKVLNHWEVGIVKTVAEYVEIIMMTAARNEAMAAKLMRALTTHLRAEGECLKRVELPGQ